jgi:hypothetical protein
MGSRVAAVVASPGISLADLMMMARWQVALASGKKNAMIKKMGRLCVFV